MEENETFYQAITHNQFYKDLVIDYAGIKIILWKMRKLTNLQASTLSYKLYYNCPWFTRVLNRNKIFLEIVSAFVHERDHVYFNMKDIQSLRSIHINTFYLCINNLGRLKLSLDLLVSHTFLYFISGKQKSSHNSFKLIKIQRMSSKHNYS